MKKIVLSIVGVLVFIVFLLYAILFTQPGNNLLKPTIESKINSALHTNMKLENFSLRLSTFSIKLTTPSKSYFALNGDYGIFSKFVNAKYKLNIGNKEDKLVFNNIKIKGAFFFKGTAKGFLKKKLVINGVSNIAQGATNYRVVLKNFKTQSIVAKIKNMKLEKILHTISKSEYAKALINGDINFETPKKDNYRGTAKIYVSDGSMDTDIMKKDFKVNIPKTHFKALGNINLNRGLANFRFQLNSNLGGGKIYGKFNRKSSNINSKYNINILNLAVLKPIINTALRGAFSTSGAINGKIKKLFVSGTSNIANGITDYKFKIEDKKIKNIALTVKNAKLNKVLYLVNQPQYAYGNVFSSIKIQTLDMKKLSGKITADVKNGVVNSSVVKKVNNVSMPRAHFKLNFNSTIKNSIANFLIRFKSSIGNVDFKNGVFDISKATLNGNYKVYIPNLDKLYFLSKRHLRGSTVVTGVVKKDKNLTVLANSKMFSGALKAKLVNDNLTVSAMNIQSVKVTDMLLYPKIFDSKGNVDLFYNLLSKKGLLKAEFVNGHILPNEVTFLLHQATRFDIAREIYKRTTLRSQIDNGVILSNLDMKSRLTHITSKKALTDFNKNKIDAKLKIEIKKKPTYVTISGDLNKPKIKLNLKSLFKDKIKKKMNKILNKKKLNNLFKGF